MKRIITLSACAAASLAMASAPASADDHSDKAEAPEMTKGEKDLAEMLEGRVAGEPQRCIRTRINERLRVIDRTAYVYGSGKTIYVQRTKNPEQIDSDEVLVSRRFNATQLCKLDMITTVDRFFGMFAGAVFFEDFVPYTKAEQVKETG